jgi:lipooligosaccharide transport system permease protein
MTLLARVAPPFLFGSRRAGLLIERNLMVYRRGWLVIVSGFFEPLFYLLSIGLGIGALVGSVAVDGQEIPYTAFVAPALLASSAMNGAIYDSTFNVFFKLNYAKTYDAILSTPVGVGDVALGEIGWALIRGGIYAAAFLIVMFVLGMVLSPWAILAFPAALLVGFAFGAAGMAATSFMRTWQDFDLVQLVILPFFLFSATFYPITTYPEPIDPRPAHAALPRGRPDPRPHRSREPDAPGPRRLPRRDGHRRPGDLLAPPGQAAAQVGTAPPANGALSCRP